MADAQTVSYIFTGNASSLVGATGAVQGALAGLESTSARVANVITGAFELAAKSALAAGAAVSAGLGVSIKVAADYEQQLSAIAAVSNKVELEAAGGMNALSQVALQLGKDTAFSAREAAAGMEEMVKAGVGIQDVMGGGARAALDLAAAGAVSVSEAATVAATSMNAFALKGSDLTMIADTLAGASVASATDVHQLGYALQSVGAVAHTVGLSFEDTTTAIAVLASAGLKGSDAGTSLKTMLMNLSPSTDKATTAMKELGIITADGANQFFTAEGSAKSMGEIAEVLQRSLAGLTKQQQLQKLETIFGTDAIRAAAIMAEQGAEGFAHMAAEMGAAGTAQDIANKRLDNLKGSLERLRGTLETIAISVGMQFTPILKRGVDVLTEAFNQAEPAITAFAKQVAAGIEAMIPKITELGTVVLDLGRYFLAVATDGDTLNDWLTHLPAPVAKAAQAIAELSIAIGTRLRSSLQWIVDTLGRVDVFGMAADGVNMLLKAVDQLLPIITTLADVIIQQVVSTFVFLRDRVLPPVVSILTQVGTAIVGLIPFFQQVATVGRDILGGTLDWLAKSIVPSFLSIVNQTAAFLSTTVLPTLTTVASTLRSVLGDTLNWIATTVWPAFLQAATVAWTFFTGTILPEIPKVAAGLRTLLGGAIQWVGQTGWPLFVAGATIAWQFINEKVIPAIQSLISWLQQKLPPVIAALTTAWEAVRSRVAPILEALFNGDVKTAITKMGEAFKDLGTLVFGWIKDQIAQVDWAQVWAASVDIAGKLLAYLKGLTIDFATWLGEKIGAVDWAQVWEKSVDIAGKLATYLKGLVVDFATWLGEQAGKVEWASVWQNLVNVTQALLRYLQGQAVDFANWLGKQVEKIPWATVWEQSKLTAKMIVDGIAAGVGALDTALTNWVNQAVRDIKWDELGREFGRQLSSAFIGGASPGGGGGGGNGQLDTAALKAAFLTFITSAWDQAYADWNATNPGQGLVDTIIRAIQNLRTNGTAEYAAFWQDANGVQTAGTAALEAQLAEHHAAELAAWKAHREQVTAEANAQWMDSAGIATTGTSINLAIFTKWLSDTSIAWNTWVGGYMAAFNQWLTDKKTALTTWVADAWKILSDGWDAIWRRAGEAWDAIWAMLLEKWNAILGGATTWLANIGKMLSDGWNQMWSRAGEAWDAIHAVIMEKINAITGFFTQTIPEWGQAGLDMATKFVEMVKQGLSNLLETVVGPVKGAIDAVRRMLPGWGGGTAGASPGGNMAAGSTPMSGVSAVKGEIDNSSREAFIRTAYPYALEAAKGDEKIAQQLLSMAITENGATGSGRSLGEFGFNVGGIQGVEGTAGSFPAYDNGNLRQFAAYNNLEEGFQAVYNLITQSRLYQPAYQQYQQTGDIDTLVQQINRAGYAENPNWYQLSNNVRNQQVAPITSTIPVTPVTMTGGATTMGATRPTTFDMSQTQMQWDAMYSDALSICGPYLASLFTDVVGRPPTRNEAVALAEKMGIYSSAGGGSGILNASQFDEYATALIQQINPGSTATVQQQMGVSNAQATDIASQALASGQSPLVGFNTEHHYFGADAFNTQTGQFHVGGTGLSLQGGSEWMSVDEMTSRMGSLQGVLTMTGVKAEEAGGSVVRMGDAAGTANQQLEPMAGGIQQTNASIITLAGSAGSASTVLEGVGGAAATSTSSLANMGAALDPVVASYDAGITSIGGLTDAVIESAGANGIATLQSQAYSEGLITQDQALRGVIEAMAQTTPAAAELLTQFDAGAISAADAAVAIAGMATTTAEAEGALTTTSDATTTMGESFKQLGPAVDESLVMMNDSFAAAAETVPETAGELAVGVADAVGPMSDTLIESSDQILTTIGDTAANVGELVISTTEGMAEGSIAAAVTMSEGATTAADTMQVGVQGAVDTMNTGVLTTAGEMQVGMQTAADTMVTGTTTAAGTMQTGVQTAVDTMNTGVQATSTEMAGAVQGTAESMSGAVQGTAEAMSGAVQGTAEAMAGGVQGAADTMASGAESAADTMASGVQSAADTMQSGAQGAAEEMQSGVVGATENMASESTDAAQGIDGVVQAIEDIEGDAQSAAEAVGQAVAEGIADGMDEAVKEAQAAAKKIISAVNSAMKAMAKISSPSRMFAEEIGWPIVQGIAKGMDEQRPALQSASGKLMQDLRGWSDYTTQMSDTMDDLANNRPWWSGQSAPDRPAPWANSQAFYALQKRHEEVIEPVVSGLRSWSEYPNQMSDQMAQLVEVERDRQFQATQTATQMGEVADSIKAQSVDPGRLQSWSEYSNQMAQEEEPPKETPPWWAGIPAWARGEPWANSKAMDHFDYEKLAHAIAQSRPNITVNGHSSDDIVEKLDRRERKKRWLEGPNGSWSER